MKEDLALPGFERLLETCKRTGYELEVRPPGHNPPSRGLEVAGYPLDPMLAALYQRMGGLRCGGSLGEILLVQWDDEVNGIVTTARELRRPEEPFHSTVLFGAVSGLAWYYATVPVLADARGLQPVVFINAYEEQPVQPVASNVDRFFHVFSRYIEKLVRDEECQRGETPGVIFPEDMVEEVARDEPLVEMLKAGRFHFLLQHAAYSFEWVEKVLAARR